MRDFGEVSVLLEACECELSPLRRRDRGGDLWPVVDFRRGDLAVHAALRPVARVGERPVLQAGCREPREDLRFLTHGKITSPWAQRFQCVS